MGETAYLGFPEFTLSTLRSLVLLGSFSAFDSVLGASDTKVLNQ